MDACDLTNKKCKPCEGGIPPLKPDEARKLLSGVPGWTLMGNKNEGQLKGASPAPSDPLRIERDYELGNFVEALRFVNRIGDVAESEGHHPDIHLYSYKRVRIELYTHAVNGLTENDFIVAAKIDTIGK